MTIDAKTQWVNIDDLQLWDRNYNQGDIGAIVVSIQKFGFLNALRVWKDNTVMAGNHSLLAVRQLVSGGWTPYGGAIRMNGDDVELMIVDMTYLPETRAEAFAIADNRIAGLAEPDNYKLAELLQDIANDEDGSLLDATGYDGDDLDDLLSELGDVFESEDAPDAQIDKAQELQTKWQVERGQVWQVGKHRVMCGDSTNADDVVMLMGGVKAGMVFTDPPYNIVGTVSGADDGSGIEIMKPFFNGFASQIKAVTNLYSHIYICCDFRTYSLIYDVTKRHNTPVKNCIVWDKGNGGLGSYYQNSHEFIAFCVNTDKKRVSNQRSGARLVNGQSNIWRENIITATTKDILHSAMKPLALPIKAIGISSDLGDVLFDPFLGSGTTLVACEQTGRIGYGMEIAPEYVAVTLERLTDMGLEATLTDD